MILEGITFALAIFALGLSLMALLDTSGTKTPKVPAWLHGEKIRGRIIGIVAIVAFVLYLMWAHDLLRVELFEYTARALTENWTSLILAASLLATPLTLAAVGECLSERAGLFNIGLEGIFFLSVVIGVRGAENQVVGLGAGAGAGAVIGALVALAVAEKLGRFAKLVAAFVGGLAGGLIGYFIMSIVIAGLGGGAAGLLVGALTGALIGFIFSVMAVYLRANQLVLGMGINIFATGMLAFLLMTIWGFPGIHSVRPVLHIPKLLGYLTPVFFVAVIVAIVAHIILHKTLFGLRIRAAGEKPEAVDVAGVRIDRMRVLVCTAGAALAGLGGAFFSLGWFGEIVKEMAVGMGFIALAVVVVAGLEPLLALVVAFVFGFVRVLADWVATSAGISSILPGAFYLMHMVPFIVTLLVVTIFIGRRPFPKALGKPYIRE
jgi:simple sugar transport system permease protein